MAFLRRTHTFCQQLKGTAITARTILVDTTDLLTETYQGYQVSLAVYLESFMCNAFLPDIAQTPFPDIKVTESQQARLTKVIAQESQYNHLLIPIEFQKAGSTDWIQVARPTVMNRGRETQLPLLIPYLVQGNVPKLLEPGDKVAINPYLATATTLTNNSYLSLHGEYRIEINLIPTFSRNYTSTQVSTPYTLAANANREYLLVQNLGDDNIIFSFDGLGTATFNLTPLGNTELTRPPRTAISFTADTSQTISILEGFS